LREVFIQTTSSQNMKFVRCAWPLWAHFLLIDHSGV
jgi:hypothetical protein